MNSIIIGRNAVMEAIKNGRSIDKILIMKGAEGNAHRISAKAKKKHIRVNYLDRKALDRIAGNENHQGVIAYAAPYEYSDVSEILVLAEERGEEPFIVILDGIEDPHNLGAVLRSAEGAGVHGVIIARNRAAALTDAAVKVSAGAAEYMLLSRVTNLARTVDELKKKGVWIWGCDVSGSEYGGSDMTGPVALVIGNEGRGISRLLGEKCDFMVSIPMRGKINSLNASNAAAVLMYEVDRQRHAL